MSKICEEATKNHTKFWESLNEDMKAHIDIDACDMCNHKNGITCPDIAYRIIVTMELMKGMI